MNIVIYARYSSDRQTEASIEGQLKVCYDYAKQNGYNVIGEYIDRALTGKTSKRPDFQKMIKDSEKKNFEAVLVYQLDRFSRNRYDSAMYKAKLKRNGVRVISARESITDDASGVLMESLLEGMAEYYSKELSQKVTRGMLLNAEKCKYNGGTIPFGYKIIDKQYVINDETAPYVKRIFEMYSQGHTIKEIITFLNERGLRTASGTRFNYNSLHSILVNKKYIGIYTYGNVAIKDGIPRIVSDELFGKVQTTMEKNKKAPARTKAIEDYLLTTKLFCGHCKEAMVGVSGTSKLHRKYCYYACNNARKKKKCDKHNVSKEKIENFVVDICRTLLTDENIDIITQEAVAWSKESTVAKDIQNIEKEIKRLEKKKANFLSDLSECDIPSVKKDIYVQIGKLNDEIEEAQANVARLKNENAVLDENEVKFFLYSLRNGDVNDIKYRKLLVNVFVNRIYLYDDKLKIVLNLADKEVEYEHNLIDECEETGGSDLSNMGSPKQNNPNFVTIGDGFGFLFYLRPVQITGKINGDYPRNITI